MVVDKYLRSRGRALEESFFARENEELLNRLREQAETEARKEALAAATGITDDGLLSKFVELDLCGETVMAAALVPLIEVAWADGKVQDREREAILHAAEDSGISKDSTAHKLLENWLDSEPEDGLFTAWRDYVGALCEVMGEDDGTRLKQELMGRARTVAEAAGGFLGLARISAEEHKVLEQLEQALS